MSGQILFKGNIQCSFCLEEGLSCKGYQQPLFARGFQSLCQTDQLTEFFLTPLVMSSSETKNFRKKLLKICYLLISSGEQILVLRRKLEKPE